MYKVGVLTLLMSAFLCTSSFAFKESAAVPPAGTLQGVSMMAKNCDLEARNSLIHEDISLVEKICFEAIETLEQSGKDNGLLINSLLNLAIAYSFAGIEGKAAPLYEKASRIGKKVYPPGSRELKEIESFIERQEEFRKLHSRH